MTCGTCKYTDRLFYTSMPPQVKCDITGKFHYYDDECDCSDSCAVTLKERNEILDILNSQTPLMAINYDSNKAPSVVISGAEAEVAYKSLIRLPLYGEAEGHVETDTEAWKYTAPIAVGSTSCLVCGESITVNMWESYVKICPTCKKAIMFIREKFDKELERYEV